MACFSSDMSDRSAGTSAYTVAMTSCLSGELSRIVVLAIEGHIYSSQNKQTQVRRSEIRLLFSHVTDTPHKTGFWLSAVESVDSKGENPQTPEAEEKKA